MSHIGDSLICFASPKSTQKSAPLRSQNFVNEVVFGVRGTNVSKSVRIYEYFNKATAKKLVSKSDSGLKVLANGGAL